MPRQNRPVRHARSLPLRRARRKPYLRLADKSIGQPIGPDGQACPNSATPQIRPSANPFARISVRLGSALAVVPTIVAALQIWIAASGNPQSIAIILASASLPNLWVNTLVILFLNSFFFAPTIAALFLSYHEWQSIRAETPDYSPGRSSVGLTVALFAQLALAYLIYGFGDSNGQVAAMGVALLSFYGLTLHQLYSDGSRDDPRGQRLIRRMTRMYIGIFVAVLGLTVAWIGLWTITAPIFPLERVSYSTLSGPRVDTGYVLAVEDVSLTLQIPQAGRAIRIPAADVQQRDVCSADSVLAPRVQFATRLLFPTSPDEYPPSGCTLDYSPFWR